MLKKFFVGIFLGILTLGAIYLYFLYAGDPNTIRYRIQKHQLYTTIFFISIVLLYMLQGGSKIFRFLMVIIVLINLYILGDVFFRNNIGLDSRQFIILFALILLALAITYITHRVRFIFMSIVGVGIVFVLLMGILPMYETIPNINDFIQSQKIKILNKGATEGTLIIKNALGSKEIPIKELQKNDLDLTQKTQISFISKMKGDTEKVFIDLGNGGFINIDPQSALTLQKSGEQTVMQILQGNVKYYIPNEFSGVLKIIGKYKGKDIEEIQDSIREDLVNEFKQKKDKFFIEQIGGDVVVNPTVNKIIGFFINTLYNISPKTYQKNLVNYTNIQHYLGLSNSESSPMKMTGETFRNIMNDMMSQAKKSMEETNIHQRLYDK